MNKKTGLLSALIFALAFISGCTYGSGSSTGSVEINTFSRMSASYQKFSGYKTADLHVKEGEALEVSVNIVSKKESLILLLLEKQIKKLKRIKRTRQFTKKTTFPLRSSG